MGRWLTWVGLVGCGGSVSEPGADSDTEVVDTGMEAWEQHMSAFEPLPAACEPPPPPPCRAIADDVSWTYATALERQWPVAPLLRDRLESVYDDLIGIYGEPVVWGPQDLTIGPVPYNWHASFDIAGQILEEQGYYYLWTDLYTATYAPIAGCVRPTRWETGTYGRYGSHTWEYAEDGTLLLERTREDAGIGDGSWRTVTYARSSGGEPQVVEEWHDCWENWHICDVPGGVCRIVRITWTLDAEGYPTAATRLERQEQCGPDPVYERSVATTFTLDCPT